MPNYYEKYLKYKNKYIEFKKANKAQIGGLFDITKDLCVYNDINGACALPKYFVGQFTRTETFQNIINNFFADIDQYITHYDNRYAQGENINKLSHLILFTGFSEDAAVHFGDNIYNPTLKYTDYVIELVKNYIIPIYKYAYAEYYKIDMEHARHTKNLAYMNIKSYLASIPGYKDETNWHRERIPNLDYLQNPIHQNAFVAKFGNNHFFNNLIAHINNLVNYQKLMLDNLIKLLNEGMYHILFIILLFIGKHKY